MSTPESVFLSIWLHNFKNKSDIYEYPPLHATLWGNCTVFPSRKTERRNGMKRTDYFWTILPQINKYPAPSVNHECGWLDTNLMIAFYCVSKSEAVIQLLSYSKASVDPNLCELKWNSSTANLQLVHFCELTQAHCPETETRGIIVCLQQLSDCLSTLHLLQFVGNIRLLEKSARRSCEGILQVS